MNCPGCNTLIRFQQLYCGHCGEELGKPCPSCFFVTAKTDNFCVRCRHAFQPTVAVQPMAQRSVPPPLPEPPATVHQGINTLWQEAQLDDDTDIKRRKNLTQSEIDRLFGNNP